METASFDPGPPPAGELAVTLTESQVDAFHRDGFVAVGRVTTVAELDWLRDVVDHLFSAKVGGFRGAYFDLSRPYNSEGEDSVPQVLYPSSRVRELQDTILRRVGLAVASQLLEADPGDIQVWDHMIRKPPRHGQELPWHQDEAYWDTGFRYKAIGCWMPLDDATVDNGCLHFLPGSHLGPVLPHRHIGDDPAVHGLETDVDDDRDAVAVELAAGEATFHHCRTLHRSGPNRTDGQRRAYANEYQLAPIPCEDDEPRPWVREGQLEWAKAIAASSPAED